MPGSFTGQRWGGVVEISQSTLKEISPEYSLMLSIDVSINAKIEVPVIWPLVGKTQFIGKVPDAQKV